MESVARSQSTSGADAALPKDETLIYRQSRWTRLTHWLWAISLFFMLLSGLQIFNARPQLYIGKQSGFGYNNTIFAIGAENTTAGPRGYTEIFGHRFDTTGVLGWSGPAGQETSRAFPSWATIPSYYDLGTARVVHFFFAWILTTTLHRLAGRQPHQRPSAPRSAPRLDDLKRLPQDIIDHAKLKFHHTREYNTLQKMAYGGVLFVLLPLMIITGLAMSPSMNSVLPFLNDCWAAGRRRAPSISP